MRTNSTDVADFYRQISLLLKSGLPIPESIEQLGLNFAKPDFSSVLSDIAKTTSEGKSLSESMKAYPQYFTRLHIQMIEAAEKSGMLPETLSEIARTSHMNLQLTSMIRELAMYPLFAIWFSLSLVFILCTILTPQFTQIFENLLEGEPLPWLTDQVMHFGNFILEHQNIILIILIIYPIFFIWLLSGTIPAKRTFLQLISFIPGSFTIFHNLTMARLCSMWSILMRQNLPADQAIEITRQVVEDSRVSAALKRSAAAIQAGKSIVDALSEEKRISGMIPLTIKHVPENELPAELANLAHLFRERASVSSKKFNHIFSIILFILMTVIAGTIVIAMFMPLISIMSILGGF